MTWKASFTILFAQSSAKGKKSNLQCSSSMVSFVAAGFTLNTSNPPKSPFSKGGL
jgi:hypothetical protein